MAMNELTTLAKISDLIEPMTPDERRRVMAYLNDKYGNGSPPPKKQQQFTLVESLVLEPTHGESARSMAERYELKRENKQIKCLIAVHYLSDFLPKNPYATEKELKRVLPVSVEHVATFFLNANWELPADLFNTISQTGTSGWIDSSSATNLKTTEQGRALLNEIHEPIYLETFKSRKIHADFIPGLEVTNPRID